MLFEYGEMKEEKLIISNRSNDSNLNGALERYLEVLAR